MTPINRPKIQRPASVDAAFVDDQEPDGALDRVVQALRDRGRFDDAPA